MLLYSLVVPICTFRRASGEKVFRAISQALETVAAVMYQRQRNWQLLRSAKLLCPIEAVSCTVSWLKSYTLLLIPLLEVCVNHVDKCKRSVHYVPNHIQ